LLIWQRRQVTKACKEEDIAREEHRKQAMIRHHAKQEAAQKKLAKEKQELMQWHLIVTSSDLFEQLVDIDRQSVSITKKKSLKHKSGSGKKYWGKQFL